MIGWLVVSVVIVLAAMAAAARHTPKPNAEATALGRASWPLARTQRQAERQTEPALVPSCAVR